jgi:hypothetical protein
LIATQGRLFSHIGDARCYCSSMSSPSDTTRSLSAGGHSCSDNNTRSLSLSLSLLRRSLVRSVCSDFPTGLSRSTSPAACALRIALNFSPQKASAAAGWSAACATAKGARADVDRAILRVVATTATPPPILLLSRARLIESPRQGKN